MPSSTLDDHQIWLEAAANGLGEDPDVDQLTLSLAHPDAHKLIPDDEFLYNVAPLADDTGSDVFAYYRYWTRYGRKGNSSLVFLSVMFTAMGVGDYNDMAFVINQNELAKKMSSPEAKIRRQLADEIIIATALSEIFYTGVLTKEIQQLSARALVREAAPCILGLLQQETQEIRKIQLRAMGEVIAPSPKVQPKFF